MKWLKKDHFAFHISVLCINRFLDIESMCNRRSNPAIMFDFIQRQKPAFSILQPFIANLVAADAVLPDVFRDSLEVLFRIMESFIEGFKSFG